MYVCLKLRSDKERSREERNTYRSDNLEDMIALFSLSLISSSFHNCGGAYQIQD
jgi:hypothetical protein